MRRHETLIPLSRFHRSVLFLALVTKRNAPKVKGYPEDTVGKRNYALDFYKTKLLKHIQQEEELLFPQVQGFDETLDQLIGEIKQEHRMIHQIFENLEHSETNFIELLYELGALLEKHVRKEERVLFQKIQEIVGDEELSKISLKN